ncbi:unnamed protein product, partial [Nippostrongylus brasiliensis]|uniref:Uncharacterized protein n=1 Tax=Nippostrongylus brasiliensis TaxID=27835 RepID=A0A0N4XDB7_NIPBR
MCLNIFVNGKMSTNSRFLCVIFRNSLCTAVIVVGMLRKDEAYERL